jgi:hypothetical protein
MIANAKHVGNPPQSSAESREIPAYRVLIALAQTPVLAALTRHRSKNPADRGKRLSDGARLFVMRLASRFSHFVPDPKAPAYLIGRAEADRQNRATRWTAWETQRHTANGLCCDERTVRRYLVEAVDAGIITVDAQTTRDEDGKPRTWNRYAVRFPAYWFNERRMDDGTSRTAAWIAKPPERRKRKPKAAPTHGALPDGLPRHDDWDAEPPCLTPDETHAELLDPIPDLPAEWRETCGEVATTERTEMSASERTEMSANTGNGEQGKTLLSGICRAPGRAGRPTRFPQPSDPEADLIDADADPAVWRNEPPDAPAGDAGTPCGATAHNGSPDGLPDLAGGREALRAPQGRYVDPRLASIPEHLRGRVSRLQRQQAATVGRTFVRGIGYDIERAHTRACVEHGRKYDRRKS